MTLDTTKPRIFVQIASYRDTECNPTIRDMFEQAAHPERIFAGVCWQFDPATDQKCFAVDYPRKDQVRTVEYHIRDAKGAGWARVEAQKLYRGEEYLLQIQAHHRFEPGWDNTLIELLHRYPSQKAILTGWLPGYTPRDGKQPLNARAPLAVVSHLGKSGDVQMVHFIKRDMMNDELFGKLLPTCSWIGNFMFARASVMEEVPFDPHIYFWGEEINYSVRLWTHGYDIYHIDRVVLYHYWNRHYKENNDAKDASIYRNHTDERNRLSLERNLYLLKMKDAVDPAALVDFDKYTLGTERSIEDYWKFAGIDLVNGAIANHAKLGTWSMRDVPTPKSKQHVKRPKIFVGIASYRDSECQWTLKDMFAKAAHPELLRVGICLQLDPVTDKHCMVSPDYPQQVKIKQIHYNESRGANWARAEALALREDEEYVLQIDSHMRFEQDWDEALIAMLERCPNEKSVLCTYLPNYDPPDARTRYPRSLIRIRVRKFGADNDPQLLHVTGVVVFYEEEERVTLYPSPFYIANFMFGRANVLDDVPIDPHFHFYGDELSYSARLWTHGYDIYQPDATVMYHYWVRKETLHLQHYRNIRTEKSLRSYKRGIHLLGMGKSDDPEALAELDKYGLGKERSLDDLWAFAGIDWKTRSIAKDAEEGRWNMAARNNVGKKGKQAAPAKKASVTEKKAALPRIFVQIASYRDPDCQNTVKELFEKASHPERIFVGICWQFVKGEDDICFQVPYPRPDQVRVHEVDARKGKGVCWARGLTQKLWQGEEFTLQIDSHMRFEPGWDDSLLEMWEQCDSDSAVLTCYPPGFTPPRDIQTDWVYGMAAKEFDKEGIFLMHGKPPFRNGEFPARPIPGAFASACMYFGPGRMIKDVPYDPHLYFFGEEISLAVRFWTHGYDLFHPNRLCIYHDWDRNKRPTHFSDHSDWTHANARSFARVRHMLGTEPSYDPAITKELEIYGLGNKRTLQEYQAYSGVNFANRTISEQALSGVYQPYKVAARSVDVSAPAQGNTRHDGSIYVQIASYRDRECQWTVKDLFEKAENPDKVFVGICWQFDEEEDKDCFQVQTRPDQVRVLPVDWREAEGVCWARHMTQQMWDGEEYTLMIDSHMRFVPGWDRLMIEELRACESAKPVITCSPASYTPPDNLEKNPRPAIRRVNPFQPDGNLRGKGESIDRSPPKPLNGAFVSAGFVFSRAEIIEEVPYDPYLYFDQEEITYALRLYSHGWDVFSSRRHLLYHYYNTNHRDTVRPLHWKDLHQKDHKRIAFLRDRGLNRFNHITGHSVHTDFETIRELDKYGLGRARSLSQFEEYTGIDFKRKVASEKALRCGFIKDLAKYRDKPIYVPELDGPNPPRQQATPPTAQQDAINLNPVGEARKTLAEYPMLEPGDFAPFFEVEDTNRKARALELYGGRHCAMFFLPANKPDYVAAFFRHLHQVSSRYEKMENWMIFILDDTVDNLISLREKVKTQHLLWADHNRAIASAFGLCKAGEKEIVSGGYVLSNNLRIITRHTGLAPEKLAEAVMKDCYDAIALYKQKNREPQVITELPPALIIPNAFTPEFCKKLIEAFRSGKSFDGTVGAEGTAGYRPNAKMRTDFIPSGKLLEEIDEKMSRSVFPEISKIFGFEVTHREVYKIGLYTGEKGGFFKQHRDNFDLPLGYRRVAMTIHLSDNYEGGGLRFPEYDENIYRPALGSAIAFSGSTLHEARPVTSGERFVLVAFIHGIENEAFRRHYLTEKSSPLKAQDYVPALRVYPELKQSRDFFRNWYKDNAHFNEAPQQAPSLITSTQKPLITESPNMLIQTLNGHQPKKVYESKSAIIFDDFLPEDVYQRVNSFALGADYEYINTKGKVARAWHVQDGFPLRSTLNLFYYANDVQKPQGDYVYPTRTELDTFTDHLMAAQPYVQHMTGKEGEWGHFSVTAWIYPHGTGLAMHDDGSGVYTGAFVYFLNPVWRPHWGGLLLMIEEEGNKIVHDHRRANDQMEFYRKKWLHANNMDDMLMEHGFAKCIFPKRNRIVFIANEAYHMVTRVNEQSGDNLRMSLAGFFDRKKQ